MIKAELPSGPISYTIADILLLAINLAIPFSMLYIYVYVPRFKNRRKVIDIETAKAEDREVYFETQMTTKLINKQSIKGVSGGNNVKVGSSSDDGKEDELVAGDDGVDRNTSDSEGSDEDTQEMVMEMISAKAAAKLTMTRPTIYTMMVVLTL